MIEISKIRMDGGTQARAEIHEDTVAEYAEAMADPDTVFPPCIIYYDGKDYWLADGFHRVAAWSRAGRIEVPAEVRQGDRRRAILHSVAANAAHGLRRSNADKRRAVMTLLEDDEWSQWSNREIARRCGVSDPFVAKVREEASANGLQMPAERTVERGGVTYQQDTSNIGKARPVEQPDTEEQDQPAASGDEPERQPGEGETTPEAVTTQSEPVERQPTAADQPEEADEPEAAPDPYGYAKLTEEALLDLANGLRADLDDERAKVRKANATIKDLKEKLAQHTSDDKDAVIRALNQKVKNAGDARQKALNDRDAFNRQLHARKAEIEKLKKQLANQEIVL